MSLPAPIQDLDDDEAAELAALTAAVAEADADPVEIPHAKVRAWLLDLAAGRFDVPPPTSP